MTPLYNKICSRNHWLHSKEGKWTMNISSSRCLGIMRRDYQTSWYFKRHII